MVPSARTTVPSGRTVLPSGCTICRQGARWRRQGERRRRPPGSPSRPTAAAVLWSAPPGRPRAAAAVQDRGTHRKRRPPRARPEAPGAMASASQQRRLSPLANAALDVDAAPVPQRKPASDHARIRAPAISASPSRRGAVVPETRASLSGIQGCASRGRRQAARRSPSARHSAMIRPC